MSDDPDLGPATTSMAALLDGVGEEMLDRATPSGDWTVGDLLDHAMGFSLAFAEGARKESGVSDAPPSRPHAANLPDDWRSVLPARLGSLAAAWQRPEALKGKTTVGGVTLPAPMHLRFALQEVLVHGWDLAAGTDQHFEPDDTSAEALLTFLTELREQQPDLPPELMGPVVEVPERATPFHRALGLSGRDPAWQR